MSEQVSNGGRVTAVLTRLAADLRDRGVRAGTGELVAAHRALAAVDSADRDDAYFALRASLCASRADFASFDAAFAACFGREVQPAPPPLDEVSRLALPHVALPGADKSAPEPSQGLKPVPAAWSDVELLRHKDFAAYSDRERALAMTLIARLARRGPQRHSRRTRPSRRRGHQPDLRRTVRASLRHYGEPVDRRWRRPTLRPRPMVLVCDVSGSMEPYARMLLAYLHASVAGRGRVEAFVFGTRLTRVTPELRRRDPDQALRRAAAAVEDWSGGTRIGAAVAELNRAHGRRLGRGAVIVLLSDGWDRGDPELLSSEMARLRRCSHAVVWLNPLKASPDYEPLTRGMVAALPHVDHLLAGNSIASLQELADLLEGGGLSR